MSRITRLKRLVTDAERRLSRTQAEVLKVSGELRELRRRLLEAEQEELQLVLPLSKGVRGISAKWAAILEFMVLRNPNPVSIDEILKFASDNQLVITRSAVRAQLHNFSRRGFVERVSDGLYISTETAKLICD